MLWLALYFPQLPLEVFSRGRQQTGPLAIVETDAGRERIARCNGAAQGHGIRPGLALSAALALHGGLALRARERERERQALRELALWAYQFSARIAFEPSLLLLEVGASRRLFGGLAALLDRVQREAAQLGYSTQHALAPTATAAGLLARRRPGCRVDTLDALRAVAASLPLAALTRDPDARALIRHIGLASIGDVLALPRAELARRCGPWLGDLLDRLLGKTPDPRPDWRPPRDFDQRIELPSQTEHIGALVFPARRLVIALCGFLRGLGGGAQRLQWRFMHRDHPSTQIDQGLLDPSRDPEHMLELLRERITRVRLPAPVTAIALRVDDWQGLEEHSLALFEATRVADGSLLERLGNRLGEQRVRGLRRLAEYRPERAWRLCRPDEAADGLPSIRQGLDQPPWLLPQPRPLPASRGAPQYGGELALRCPPERIESGWWDGGDISRDYFIAHTPAGDRLWVFHDRRGGGWYLHGFFL